MKILDEGLGYGYSASIIISLFVDLHMFGPRSRKELIFSKTKEWWELLHKLHLPHERKRLNDLKLLDIAKQMSELRADVRDLELKAGVDLEEMVDFDKLKEYFFKQKKFHYGKPIIDIRKRIRNI